MNRDSLSQSDLTSSQQAMKIMRSGMLRYPREMWRSLRAKRDDILPASVWETPDFFETHQLVAAWLGHASVLLRVGETTVLTDPVLDLRIGPRFGRLQVGLARLGSTPVEPAHLPDIDVILISHAHFDHLDKPTLERLVHSKTIVVTARQTRRFIPRGFRHVIELDWERTLNLTDLAITAIKPNHWGARTAWDRHRGYNSYILQDNDHRVLFAGDTALTDAFNEIHPIDLALFGIGAYDPWEHAHATPEQVWQMFSAFKGRNLLPIHHSTFKMSDEEPDEPIQRLINVASPDHLEQVIQCVPGEAWAKTDFESSSQS